MQQVDGLGRNAAMYCVHGNTPAHLECLQMLITAGCDLDLQANGMKFAWVIHSFDNEDKYFRIYTVTWITDQVL